MSLKKSTKKSLTSQMDRNVRQMMNLIEDDGDSFAQKAEMYYQKRPELISLVEEFYRGYRSLAERYEGELLKNVPSDVQSQTSGVSDNSYEPSGSWLSASPKRVGRRLSSNRAAGFDFFLGSAGNNNGYDSLCQKDGDASSTLTDSDDEFDDASSINSNSGSIGNSSDHGMSKRVIELEIELREAKEMLFIYEQEQGEDFGVKINAYEQELKNVNEKLRLSEEEINKLKIDVEKYKSIESSTHSHDDACSKLGQGQTNELLSSTEDVKMERENLDHKLFEDEHRIAKEKVVNFEMQIASSKIEASKSNENVQQFQDQLNLAHKEIATWKTKFNCEKIDSTKLQEKVSRLETSLAERENEINDLKAVLSDTEQKMEKKSHMEEKLKGENEILKEEIKDMKNNVEEIYASLDGLTLERDNLNEEVGLLKEEMNSRGTIIQQAYRHVVKLESRAKELEDEIERQKIEIREGAEEKREAIRQLCFSLEHYRNGYNALKQASKLS